MHFSVLSFTALFIGVANAHFRLFYPLPRGSFVADDEVKFCGGYTEVTTNRSTFPLSGGFFTVRQGHPNWSAAVFISTAQNPNSFDNFTSNGQQQYARYWASAPEPGTYCIPLDLGNTNITGIQDGANVTIQIAFTGGDGDLYQCADLTLASNFTIPENITSTCANTTEASNTTSDAQASASAIGSSSSVSSVVQHVHWYTVAFFVLGGSILAM